MRKIVEAISCKCQNGTLVREVNLTNDGFLFDNPHWACTSCGRVVQEANPERIAPWPDQGGEHP
ncbi:hypothetical protein [Streptomyces sp. B6B3]|jgi:hypothetical protein|uniref:hypothetical protein n=1 Tax=Streptomyces sp. B6B3 TaxID=3153570 RepID=UPI00325F42ED